MGDYVLENNPALERLIERLGAQGKSSKPEETSSIRDSGYPQRRGWSKIPKRTRRSPTFVGARKRIEVAGIVESTSAAEDLLVEGDLRTICRYPQTADEIVLVGFDEEPVVLAEDGATVQTVTVVEDAAGGWIFDAFKAWVREVDESIA